MREIVKFNKHSLFNLWFTLLLMDGIEQCYRSNYTVFSYDFQRDLLSLSLYAYQYVLIPALVYVVLL